MNDRLLLWLASAFYCGTVILTARRLKSTASLGGAHRLNLILMLCGFALHTTFLMVRGESLQRCPLTNLFEVQAFVAWSAVLFYLLIGTAYRVSFLGAFTGPLALALCLAGLVVPLDVVASEPLKRSAWVEFHGAIAIMAFGAFGLACVVAAMYLKQEHQLKAKRLSPSFLQMPSIQQLDVMQFRLIVTGFIMLTAGMVGGVMSYRVVGEGAAGKNVWAVTVWLLYGGWLAAKLAGVMHGRRAARLTIVVFVILLGGYWGVTLLKP
jgi:ABC-type uncharacterized transport system permease subunit